MPPSEYRMTHPDISGVWKASLEAFTLVYEAKGWELLIDDDDVVQYPAPLRFRDVWTSTARYEYGDLVDRLNVAYIAKVTNINLPPESNPSTWEDVPGQAGGGSVAGVFDPVDFGADITGAADSTTAFVAAFAAAHILGGDVVPSPGIYRLDGQVPFPNDGGTPVAKIKAMRFHGRGTTTSGRNDDPLGGVILDCRYNGAGGCFDSRAGGGIEIFALTFMNGALSSPPTTPFLFTTNTSLKVHDNEFFGNSSKIGTDCDQDAIILGGTAAGAADMTVTSPFQGYGSYVRSNYFNHIRRGVLGQVYCNAVQIEDNTFWQACGSGLANGAAIEFFGDTGSPDVGNVIMGNLIEVPAYPYGIKLKNAVNNTIAFNNLYDPGDDNVGAYYMDSGSEVNLIIAGYHADFKLAMVEEASVVGKNTYLTTHQGQPSLWRSPQRFDEPVVFHGPITVSGGESAPFLVQPESSQPAGAILFIVRKAVADGGTDLFYIIQTGEFIVNGPQAGVVTFGTNMAFENLGRTWHAINSGGSGGGMKIDSGTGGSFVDMVGFAVRGLSYADGSEKYRIGPTLAGGDMGISFGPSRDTFIYKTSVGIPVLATDQPFKIGRTTTAARPSAATVEAGGVMFDTDLGIPIYSNGASWRKFSDNTAA